jgi:hypothetical protein
MKNRDYLFLLIGATTFFVIISFILQLPENATTAQFISGDPVSYWEAAKGIYTEGGKPHPLRPYFYPFLIGLPSFLGVSTNNALWIVIAFNFICWLGTVAFIYKILKNNTSNKIASIGTFIFVVNTSNIINCWSVLAESLFHFLIIGSIYFLLKYLCNKQYTGYFIAFVAFFCLSLITRPIYSPLLFLIMPLFIWAIFKKHLSLFIAATSVFIFVATVGFNAYKMRQTYGNWTLSYIGQCTIYVFYSAYAKIASPEKTIKQSGEDWLVEYRKRGKEIPRNNDSIPWTALNAIVSNDLKQQLKDNKTGLLMAFGRDLLSNSIASNGDVLQLTDFKQQLYFKPLIQAVFYWGRLLNILNNLLALCVIPLLFRRFRQYFLEKKRPIYWILMVNPTFRTFLN